LALALPGCTVVKPAVCAISLPIGGLVEAFTEDKKEKDSEEQSFRPLPTFYCVVVLVAIIPPTFALLAAEGAGLGLLTGFMSDLNFLLGNASVEDSIKSLAYPARLNVRVCKEEQEDP